MSSAVEDKNIKDAIEYFVKGKIYLIRLKSI